MLRRPLPGCRPVLRRAAQRRLVPALAVAALGLVPASSGAADDAPAATTPTGWLVRPAGRQIAMPGRPAALAVTRDGRRLLVANTGTEQSLALVDVATGATLDRVRFERPGAVAAGVVLSPDGRRAYVAGGGSGRVWRYALHGARLGALTPFVLPATVEREEVARRLASPYPAGLALSRDGRRLYVADELGDALHVIDVATGRSWKAAVGDGPVAVALCRDERCAYVANSGGRTVSLVDLHARRQRRAIATGTHPGALAADPAGRTLHVANADADTITTIDMVTGRRTATVGLGPRPGEPTGRTPVHLAVDAQRRRLYVATAGDNALTVLALGGRPRVVGRIPTGWYPSAVALGPRGAWLAVANAKGQPGDGERGPATGGTLSVVRTPGQRALRAHSAIVTANTPCAGRCGAAGGLAEVRRRVRHVIYVVKENRSFDDVFADLRPRGGRPRFGDDVAPNHRALARRFVLLDNFHAPGAVSADGKAWALGGYANHYVERNWPATYSFRNRPSDYLGGTPAAAAGREPRRAYLWDRLEAAGVPYRNYGVWASGTVPAAVPATEPELAANTDANYPGYSHRYSDQRRAAAFLDELQVYEARGRLPRFMFVSLTNDHLLGSAAHYRTPEAMMADNDLALGRIVEAVSRSPFWARTAIFVVGDDVQGDPAGGSRTVALVISPHTRRAAVDSTRYSTASMLRTMEGILGLAPLSRFDATAPAMAAVFDPGPPDLRPVAAIRPRQALDERNPGPAPGPEHFLAGLAIGLGLGAAGPMAARRRPRRTAAVR